MKRLIMPLIGLAMAGAANAPGLPELKKMIERFARAELRADTSKLSPGDQKALPKLIEAARIMDDVYLTQLWSSNHDLYAKLKKDTSPLGRARLHYFWINKSPWPRR